MLDGVYATCWRFWYSFPIFLVVKCIQSPICLVRHFFRLQNATFSVIFKHCVNVEKNCLVSSLVDKRVSKRFPISSTVQHLPCSTPYYQLRSVRWSWDWVVLRISHEFASSVFCILVARITPNGWHIVTLNQEKGPHTSTCHQTLLTAPFTSPQEK